MLAARSAPGQEPAKANMVLHIIGYSHIDAAWLRPWELKTVAITRGKGGNAEGRETSSIEV